MTKFFSILFSLIVVGVAYGAEIPNGKTTNDEAPLELFEDEQNVIPAFLEDEESEDLEYSQSSRVRQNQEDLAYLCEGVTVFVKPENKAWFEENCIPLQEE